MIHPMIARGPGSPAYLCLLLTVTCVTGCGASLSEGGDDDAADFYGEPTPEPSGGAGDDDDDSGGSDLPPEAGDSFYRAAPAATDQYVFVVNPDRDTVSKINATTQAVYTLSVGIHPTQVLVGDEDPDKAVVLNEGSASLSIIDTRDDGIQEISIHQDTNFMQLSDDGLYAITYYNPEVEGSSDDVNGVRSYSNISVVFTGDGSQAPTTTPIAVGLNPRAVAFVGATGEEQAPQALVLCDNALAQVALSPSPASRLIALTQDIDEDLQVAELKVGPDGHYAFLRPTDLQQLIVVDLTAEDPSTAVSRLSLSAVPTDMDLAGSALILVDRDERQLEIYQALDPEVPPAVVPTPENQLVGSIAVVPEINRAILYTTLTAADVHGTDEEDTPLNRFSVWNLETGDITLYSLVKPVEAVSVNHNPDLEVVTLIHDGDASSDIEAFDKEEAFSHFYFSDGLVVPTALEAPIKSIADAPDGIHEFMILEDNLNVVLVDYESRQVNAIQVQSQPAFVGILTGTELGYVSQEHELGRISFVDPESLNVTTITGFELNSQP